MLNRRIQIPEKIEESRDLTKVSTAFNDTPTLKEGKEKRFTRHDIANAILKAEGYIMKAAVILKCNHNTLRKYIAADEKLQALVVDTTELYLDLAETELQNLIKRGNLGAICFFLKCKGKHRGWVENSDIPHIDKPITFKYNVVTNNTINNKVIDLSKVRKKVNAISDSYENNGETEEN